MNNDTSTLIQIPATHGAIADWVSRPQVQETLPARDDGENYICTFSDGQLTLEVTFGYDFTISAKMI